MNKFPLYALVTGGRNGSLFFQSLIDGHEQIMTFPGIFFINAIYNDYLERGKLNLARTFIKYHGEFFDSKKGKSHGIDRLGPNKNEFFSVDEFNFIQYFNLEVQVKELDFNDLVRALHVAYFKSAKLYTGHEKVIFMHIHRVERLIKIKESKSYIGFFMERDPLASLSSELDTLISRYQEEWNISEYSRLLEVKLFEPNKFIKTCPNSFTLRLEDLHLQTEYILKEISKILKINFSETLLKPTFMKKKWWGDDISIKKNSTNDFNNKFQNRFDPKKFYRYEIFILQNLLLTRIRKYNYVNYSIRTNLNNFLNLIIFFPSKYEVKLIIKLIKILVIGSDRISRIKILKNIIRFVIFFLPNRVHIYKKLFLIKLELPKLIQ